MNVIPFPVRRRASPTYFGRSAAWWATQALALVAITAFFATLLAVLAVSTGAQG